MCMLWKNAVCILLETYSMPYLIQIVLQVFGALRMSVKMFLMWNSKMLIDGEGDESVETSLLEASNLVVLKVHTLFLLIIA